MANQTVQGTLRDKAQRFAASRRAASSSPLIYGVPLGCRLMAPQRLRIMGPVSPPLELASSRTGKPVASRLHAR